MKTPMQAIRNEHEDATRLFYPDGTSRLLYIRGGVCWPQLYYKDGRQDLIGYAVLCGEDVDNAEFLVLSERSFLTVDHLLKNGTNVIEHEGLASWFNRMWSDYLCRTFYWHQPEELRRRYLREVLRSSMIAPKPSLPEVHWSDLDAVRQHVWESVKRGLFRADRDGAVLQQLSLAKIGNNQHLPAVHALCCAMAGMQRSPRRPRREL